MNSGDRTQRLPQQLHDAATRGEVLSDAEKIELEQWYNSQDRIESSLLNLPDPTPETLRTLQEQVDSALSQLLTVTQRIQEL